MNPIEIFKKRTGTDHKPYTYQYRAWDAIKGRGENTVISAGTGSGKTEAALIPALETGKRIILLLPTKSLLQDQLPRVRELASDRQVVVDTGNESERTFYTADVILTSLDKFLYRLFAYGRKRWAYLYPYRIAFSRERETLLIFDEAHTYDEIIFSHFWFVLHKLTYERNIQTVLLSATLPELLINALVDKEQKHFPRPSTEGNFFKLIKDTEIRSGKVLFGGFQNFTQGIDNAWNAYCNGEQVILVVNHVVPTDGTGKSDKGTLQEFWENLVAKGDRNSIAHLNDNGEMTGTILTYHGHQMPAYRKKVLEQLKKLDKNKESYLLLTTSAMEVGVDVSATRMFTQLCDPDAFIQRIGRCARRKDENGKVTVLEKTDGQSPQRTHQLQEYLKNKLHGGDEINILHKDNINKMNVPPELTKVKQRLEYQQDEMMHRYIYDFVRENRELWEKGIIVTRQWEPSITLVMSEERGGGNYIGGIPKQRFWWGDKLKEYYSIPVSGAADIAGSCAWIFEGYDTDRDKTSRIVVGTDVALGEALRLAGHLKIKNDAKEASFYGIDVPLILLLPLNDVVDQLHRIYKDANFGFTYNSRYVSPKRQAPSPFLKRCEVELKKHGGTKLRLWWLEPREQE